jgi:hypothetical protein
VTLAHLVALRSVANAQAREDAVHAPTIVARGQGMLVDRRAAPGTVR